MSAFVDLGRLTEPDLTHCPVCSGCTDPVGHCCGDDCAPEWKSADDTPSPDARCLCDCDDCMKPWRATCDNAAEHRTCQRHGRDF